MDESGWLSIVGLANRGFLAGADGGRPRVDGRDLETYSEGVIALTGMRGAGGILPAAIEHAGNPAEPIEAYPWFAGLWSSTRTGCTSSSPSTAMPRRSW